MATYGRSSRQRQRDIQRQYENDWRECPVPGHGGFNPWQKTLGGMRRGGVVLSAPQTVIGGAWTTARDPLDCPNDRREVGQDKAYPVE